MAQAKRNPLAPGVYWIDVIQQFGGAGVHNPLEEFLTWVSESEPSVKVLRTEADTTLLPTQRGVSDPTFILFEVEPGPVPEPFPFEKLGFPDIQRLASEGVTDADRATTAANKFGVTHAPSPADSLRAAAEDVEQAAKNALSSPLLGQTLFFLVGAYILWKAVNQNRGGRYA